MWGLIEQGAIVYVCGDGGRWSPTSSARWWRCIANGPAPMPRRAALDRRSRHQQPLRAGCVGGGIDLRRLALAAWTTAKCGYGTSGFRSAPSCDRATSLHMIPWEKIDTARVPGTDGELRLMQRGAEFSIMLGTNELMNSRLCGSEAALATLAAKKIEPAAKPHLLIGGLGMGFTLRAALARARQQGADRGGRTGAGRRCLGARPDGGDFWRLPDDPRVSILETDVADIIRSHRVDLRRHPARRRQRSGRSYPQGQRCALQFRRAESSHAALRPGGVLAVWSSGPNPPFTKRLRAAGFDVNEVEVRANGKGGGARHVSGSRRRIQPPSSPRHGHACRSRR